mmetsp:Transcript_37009/g.119487  ORF Transcript_37009/g.119487 Transcript_37009/m.119487 type:complete len:602 (-) Transcript_37009:725-2530(-)
MGPRLAARVAQQHAALAVRVESERLALSHEAVQRCLGDGILAQRLHGAPQRARAVRGRVPALDDGVREGGRHVERDLHLVGAAALQLRQVELRHLGHFGAGERLEDDHLVQPVEQLRPEAGRHLSPHRAAHGLVAATAAAAPAAPAARDLEDLLRSHVGCEDKHRVCEVDHSPLVVGEPAVLEHLQQHVVHVRVRLLDLVEEHERVRRAAHCLRQLAARLVPHVPRRRAGEARDGKGLHVLRHVEAHHRLFRAVVRLRHRLCELGLPDAGGPRKDERGDGAARVAEPDARAAQRPRYGGDGTVLPDDAPVQRLLEVGHLLALVGCQLGDRDPRPVGDDLGDLRLADGCAGGAAPVVRLHLQRRASLVDQVDGLVGVETVRDVPRAELCRGGDRPVAVLDAVVLFVLWPQAGEYGGCLGDGRLVHFDRLEAPLKRGVLLDVLAVLGDRGRADALKLTARECGLEQVGRVDGSLGGARADEGMDLVDEENRLVGLRHLLEYRLKPLLEFAAVLGVSDEQAELERENAHPEQPLRRVAVDDALRDALGDRSLADARVANQHRVRLAAADEDLHAAAHLVGAPDARVELPFPRPLRQVDRALFEG